MNQKNIKTPVPKSGSKKGKIEVNENAMESLHDQENSIDKPSVSKTRKKIVAKKEIDVNDHEVKTTENHNENHKLDSSEKIKVKVKKVHKNIDNELDNEDSEDKDSNEKDNKNQNSEENKYSNHSYRKLIDSETINKLCESCKIIVEENNQLLQSHNSRNREGNNNTHNERNEFKRSRPFENRVDNREKGTEWKPFNRDSRTADRPRFNSGGDRPRFNSGGDRPRFGGNRPRFNSGGDRPRFGGNRPEFNSGGDRPRFGGNRPEFNSRGDRPRFGGNRPEFNSGENSGLDRSRNSETSDRFQKKDYLVKNDSIEGDKKFNEKKTEGYEKKTGKFQERFEEREKS